MSLFTIVWVILTLIITIGLLHALYKWSTYSPAPEEEARQRRETLFSYEDPVVQMKNSRYLYHWDIFSHKQRLKEKIINWLMTMVAVQINVFSFHPLFSNIYDRYQNVFFAIVVAIIVVYAASLIINRYHRAQIEYRCDQLMLEVLKHTNEKERSRSSFPD